MYLELAENGETVPGTQQYVPVETNQGILNVRADILPNITGTTAPQSTIDPGGIWYTTGETVLYEMPNISSNKINKFEKLTQLEFEPGTFGTEPNLFKRTIATPGSGLYGYVLKSILTQKQPVIVPTGTSSVAIQGQTPGTVTGTTTTIETKPTQKNKLNKTLIFAGIGLIALYLIYRKK